jgi:hypothetical protein
MRTWNSPNLKKTGGYMKPFAESERFIECSGRIVLECHECGEALILLGREEDWQSERTFFECHCGQTLTLMNRLEEGILTLEENRTARELLRSLRIIGTP